MLKRCNDKENRCYRLYGARGIKVCDEWQNDCTVFYRWARETGYNEGLQLDRTDNNGNYEPSNCKWVTRKDNVTNRRNTRILTFNNKTQALSKWAEELNIPYSVLADRIFKYKWTVERAFTEKYSRNIE